MTPRVSAFLFISALLVSSTLAFDLNVKTLLRGGGGGHHHHHHSSSSSSSSSSTASTSYRSSTAPSIVSCGKSTDDFQPSTIDVTPWPPIRGENIDVTVTGTIKKTVESGNVHITLYYMGIELLDNDYDLCTITSNINCPFDKGDFTRTYTQYLPDSLPRGTYDGTVTVTDQKSREVLCYNIQFTFATTSSSSSYYSSSSSEEVEREGAEAAEPVAVRDAGVVGEDVDGGVAVEEAKMVVAQLIEGLLK